LYLKPLECIVPCLDWEWNHDFEAVDDLGTTSMHDLLTNMCMDC